MNLDERIGDAGAEVLSAGLVGHLEFEFFKCLSTDAVFDPQDLNSNDFAIFNFFRFDPSLLYQGFEGCLPGVRLAVFIVFSDGDEKIRDFDERD